MGWQILITLLAISLLHGYEHKKISRMKGEGEKDNTAFTAASFQLLNLARLHFLHCRLMSLRLPPPLQKECALLPLVRSLVRNKMLTLPTCTLLHQVKLMVLRKATGKHGNALMQSYI